MIGRRKEEGCAELNREDEFRRTHMHAHTHSVERNPKGGKKKEKRKEKKISHPFF